MENQPKSGTNGFLLAALLLMTGLAGVSSYLYFTENKKTATQEVTIAERVEELSSTRYKLDSISTALDAKIAEVKKLGGDVTELEKVKEQLEADKSSLRRGQRVSIAKYEARIKEYEAFLTEKDTLIAQLNREKLELASNNEVLNTENTGLKTQRQQLRDSVTTFVSQNQELTTKVNRAAILKAQDVKVLAVNRRGKINEDDAYKARRIEKLKLQYRLLDNPLTAEEPKDVFIRLLDPTGAVVSDMASGSGTFTAEGNEMIYTAKQTVTYDRNGQQVEMLYTRGQQYKPGRYTVELYSEGFRIGKGEFAVR